MADEQHILNELRSNLENGDLVKARLVIRSLAGQRESLQRAAMEIMRARHPEITYALFGTLLDLRIGDLAIPRMEIAEQAAGHVIHNDLRLTGLSEDALIHIVTALGNSDDARAVRPLRRLLSSGAGSANLRFTAYEALSRLPLKGGGYMLAAGLEDDEPSVRIAAARAIEKTLDGTLIDGLHNLMRRPAPLPSRIVAALCQAGALRSLEALLGDDGCAQHLAAYIEQTPDVEFLEQLEPLLQRSGHRPLATMVETFLRQSRSVERPLIYAVDDSTVILRMYKAALATVQCTVRTFDNPFEAIEWVSRETPDLLFTDLNMPGIDGIELTSTLRSGHHEADFPIVMVTTQSEGADTDRARHSGVDSVIEKPFRTADLVSAISALTDYRL